MMALEQKGQHRGAAAAAPPAGAASCCAQPKHAATQMLSACTKPHSGALRRHSCAAAGRQGAAGTWGLSAVGPRLGLQLPALVDACAAGKIWRMPYCITLRYAV